MIWSVLTVSPQRELRVAGEIKAGLGLQVCVPCLQRHRKRVSAEPIHYPLMPRYVFVGSPEALPIYDLMSLRHVTGLVQFDGRIARLTDPDVDHIRRLANEVKVEAPGGHRVGDKIMITAGPFKCFEALVKEIRAGQVRIDVQMFGRTVEHWRSADQVEAL